MNSANHDQSDINEIIQKGTSGAIVLPVNPSQDAVAAACTLYLALTKLGKTISLSCEVTPKSDVIAADKIHQEIITSGDNLVISFPYVEGSIDKVDYNIQGETFNLIISPRADNPKLDPTKVSYSYTGGILDFIITIDSPNLNSLGKVYQENKAQFQGKTIINIDRHLVNDFYGTVNIVNKTSSSTSELVLRLLKDIGSEIDRDMSTNLYSGLVIATNGFTSYSVNADTFEAAAALLKLGAVKKQIKKPNPVQNQPFRQSSTMRGSDPNGPADQPLNPQKKPNLPQSKPSFGWKPDQQIKPIEDVEQEAQKETKESPQDWLKPKIFRGTGLV
ncbi:MAG: hypothetical protein HYW86_01785 [Candidatus Roizmanbacteria bacterium]|nr:MAG: hypothetical protein HYW86_01785 [Candidatus Roizmanbacteria bacterium]